jgi:putative heme-binding domain-containing protein
MRQPRPLCNPSKPHSELFKNRTLLVPVLVCGLATAAGIATMLRAQAPAQANGGRLPWQSSKIHGSPEPPLPYHLERVSGKLSFQKLTHMASAPGTKRLFVTTELGKIFSFVPDTDSEKADLFLDMPQEVKSCQRGQDIRGFDALYSIVFHPKFADNRFVYVCYVVDGTKAPAKTALRNRERVSRFTVLNTDPPRADPASEKIILEWATEKGGHNGGSLCFGPDGFLYISMGDAGPASPPDRYSTGQDVSDLLSAILRIDVNTPEGAEPYKVPADNPFVKLAGARGEIWAYGLRNPWKMSFDRATGELWVGDVGWEMWEMVYRVRKGANYGWSVVEGPQSVHPESKRGPTPILPYALCFSHADAASITGGYVYRGKRLPELTGSYICGDWMTCKVWSTRFESKGEVDRVVSHKEIAQGRMRIVAFGEDNDGELYILGYGDKADGIYHLVPNADTRAAADFPRKLSQTGLVTSAAKITPAAGVYAYTIQAEPWLDHASAERLVALPDLSSVRFYDYAIAVPNTAFFKSRVFFPKDAVLAKTISIEMERGNPGSKRRLETQILHFDGNDWFAYTYRWNSAQTDAELVPAGGAEEELDIVDREAPGGRRKQTWRYPSRAQCLICHNGWAGPPLGFTPEQLNRGGQLEQFQKMGLVSRAVPNDKKATADGKIRMLCVMADPYDADDNLTTRARSYLDVNCAHCHQNGAGGTTTIDLRAQINQNSTKLVDVKPVQGTFNLADAFLVAPGDALRSVLYYRISKTGPGRMPHIGSEIVDSRGVELIHDWIESLPAATKSDTGPLHKKERQALDALATVKSLEVAKNPDLERLLSTTSGALLLARALDKKLLPAALSQAVVAVAAARPESEIRDLFERFLPADKRVKRLGSAIDPKAILALKGDSDRGRIVFYQTSGVQCAVCHKIGTVGGAVGPDLSQIGKKYDRAKILESILDPSKDIEPAYVSHAVQLKDGRVTVGLIVSRSDKELVLRDAQAKEHRFAAGDIDTVTPQRQSLMPEQLLRDLTAQQAVDLLDFLASLKGS